MAFETVQNDGITYVYDQPRHSVYVKGFAFGKFLLLLAGFQIITGLMVADALAFSKAGVLVLLYFIVSFIVPFRLARLRVHEDRWSDTVGRIALQPLSMAAGLLAMQWMAHALDQVFLLGFLMRWFYYLGGFGLLVAMFFMSPSSMAVAAGKEFKALPRIMLPAAVLHERGARIQRDQAELATLLAFDAAASALIAAWEKKNTDEIERLLRAGDALNRKSWQAAIDIFNAARDDIDLGRGRLRQLVSEADAALATYDIDYAALDIDRSGWMDGRMDSASLPRPDLMQKLNYSRGAGIAVGKAIAGGGSWQFAAATVVFSGIMMAVNHQKLLRQLKELEGQIKTQAQAVQGDIQLIGTTLGTRMRPQLSAMISLVDSMEHLLKRLNEGGGTQNDAHLQADAFHLACLFEEAKHVLEMKAGN